MTTLAQRWLMVEPLADGWGLLNNVGPTSDQCQHATIITLMPELSGNTTLAQHWTNVGIFWKINVVNTIMITIYQQVHCDRIFAYDLALMIYFPLRIYLIVTCKYILFCIHVIIIRHAIAKSFILSILSICRFYVMSQLSFSDQIRSHPL